MSLNCMLLLAIFIAFYSQGECENVITRNITNCGSLNISCGFGMVCRDGACIHVDPTPPDVGRQDSSSTQTTHTVITESELWKLGRTTHTRARHTETSTTHHSFISGNQEFVIALVGFSILFINFCLISFCLGRMKRRRLEQQRCQAATHSSQASQTGNWNSASEHLTTNELLNMGIENAALIGELDAFSSEFRFPQVRLPPYDFSSAYHKPRPMTEEELTGEGQSDEVIVDVEACNEDPPPYSDQLASQSSPPSYDEALKVSTSAGETSPEL